MTERHSQIDNSSPNTNMAETLIWLRVDVPQKPNEGAPCNGCGICCASEPCPVAIVFLSQRRGSCRALEWDDEGKFYRCGMLLRPEFYLPKLPRFAKPTTRRLIHRWIAADTACDAPDEVKSR